MDHAERPLITAVTHSTSEAMVTLLGVRHQPGVAASIFEALAEAGVDVDMIDQNRPTGGELAEISFTVPREHLRAARAALAPLRGELFSELLAYEEIGKVSIVGAGMRSHPGVAAKVFRVLAAEDLNIDMISTSPIKISCVIPRERVESVVRALHAAFELSGPDTIRAEESFQPARWLIHNKSDFFCEKSSFHSEHHFSEDWAPQNSLQFGPTFRPVW